MDALPGLWGLTPIGFGLGVSAFVVIAVLRGSLIPRVTHEREINAERDRGNEWRESYLASQKSVDVLLSQNSELMEGARTVKAVVNAAAPPLDESTEVI